VSRACQIFLGRGLGTARRSQRRAETALVSPLGATLMNHLVSVDNKELTENLNPLDATLTKNWGVGAVTVN